MPLDQEDFEILKEMQRLCSALETDVKQMATFNDNLQAVNKRYEKLASLYQTEWQRLIESESLDATQRAQIEAMVPEGEFSIFWQDTVWNALSDTRIECVQLLKSLAKMI